MQTPKDFLVQHTQKIFFLNDGCVIVTDPAHILSRNNSVASFFEPHRVISMASIETSSDVILIFVCSYYQPLYNDLEDQPDDFLIDLIARYGQTIMNARNDLEKWVENLFMC